VDTGFQQLLHRYDSHFKKSPFVLSSTPIIPRCPPPKAAQGCAIPGCVVCNAMGL